MEQPDERLASPKIAPYTVYKHPRSGRVDLHNNSKKPDVIEEELDSSLRYIGELYGDGRHVAKT